MTISWKYIGYEVLERIDEGNEKKVPKWRTPNSLRDSKCESQTEEQGVRACSLARSTLDG